MVSIGTSCFRFKSMSVGWLHCEAGVGVGVVVLMGGADQFWAGMLRLWLLLLF